MATKLTQLNRTQYQQVCRERLSDAQALLSTKCWTGAYYMAGYAVECAFKSCIAKQTRAEDYPPSDGKEYYTHNFDKLLSLAGLELPPDPAFRTSWKTVTDWSEESRYSTDEPESELQARKLLQAIIDPEKGVLAWLQVHW